MSHDPILLLCPFCGGDAGYKDKGLRAECLNCGTRTAKMANPFVAAATIWNSRTKGVSHAEHMSYDESCPLCLEEIATRSTTSAPPSPVVPDPLLAQAQERDADATKMLEGEHDARMKAEAKLEAHETVMNLLFERFPNCQVLGDLPGCVDEERAQAQKELEEVAELRKDAERYRFWRDHYWGTDEDLDEINALSAAGIEDWDAALDRAIAATLKNQTHPAGTAGDRS